MAWCYGTTGLIRSVIGPLGLAFMVLDHFKLSRSAKMEVAQPRRLKRVIRQRRRTTEGLSNGTIARFVCPSDRYDARHTRYDTNTTSFLSDREVLFALILRRLQSGVMVSNGRWLASFLSGAGMSGLAA